MPCVAGVTGGVARGPLLRPPRSRQYELKRQKSRPRSCCEALPPEPFSSDWSLCGRGIRSLESWRLKSFVNREERLVVELVSFAWSTLTVAPGVSEVAEVRPFSVGVVRTMGWGRGVDAQPHTSPTAAKRQKPSNGRIRHRFLDCRCSRNAKEGGLISRIGRPEKTGPASRERRPKRADKPGSVESGHFSRAAVARCLKRPTRKDLRAGPARDGCPSFFLRGLAPGGVCRARPVARPAGALLPHRFTLTRRRPGEQVACPSPGGLLSVALSRSLRTVGVTHHRVLWSPDFPLRGL